MQNKIIEAEVCASTRIDANANPFYLLATLFGEPNAKDEITKSRNRRAWNRFYACLLADSEREALIRLGVSAEDLKPFSQEEENKIAAAFASRQGHRCPIALPSAHALIDFQNISFANDIGFEGFIFSAVAFSGARFVYCANFKRAVFLKESHFERAEFAAGAVFEAAVFQGPAQFQGANYAEAVCWKKATFNESAHFDNAAFLSASNFEEARFALWAAFRNTQFAASQFQSAFFAGGATFEAAVFSETAYFSRAVFADWLSFQGAHFHSSSYFHNAEMKGKTIFDEANFLKEPPEFFGAKLYQGTDWNKINWPKPKGRDKTKKFMFSYERLQREVIRLENRAAAMETLGKKMRARPILQGRMLGLPVLILSFVANNAVASSKLP